MKSSILYIVGFICIGLIILTFFTKPIVEGHGHGHGHRTSYLGGYGGSSGSNWYPLYGYYDYDLYNGYIVEIPLITYDYGYGYVTPRNAWMNI